jgi:PAS domain S-box-containing protein
MRFRGTRKHFYRLWVILFLAFALVAGVANVMSYRLASDRYGSDVREELLNIAQLSAFPLSAEEISQIKSRDDMNSPSYQRQTRLLAEVLRRTSNIRYVYVLRTNSKGAVEFVLDPTTPGDHDGDGVDDKSYPGDEYFEATPVAKQVLRTGVAAAEPKLTSDRWGTYLSAYVPLITKDGRVVGIVGVDRDAAVIQGHFDELARSSQRGFGLGLIIAIVCATIGARYFSCRSAAVSRAQHQSRRGLRILILELVLAAVSVTVLFVGYDAFSKLRDARVRIAEGSSRLDSAIKLCRNIEVIALQEKLGPNDLETLMGRARYANLGWLESLVVGAKSDPEHWQRYLREAVSKTQQSIAQAQNFVRAEEREVDNLSNVVETCSLIAVLIGVFGLVLLRSGLNRHQAWLSAEEDSVRLQSAYSSLVNHLPVGVCVLKEGKIAFSNDSWDKQCLRDSSENEMSAFERAIHPEDRDRVVEKFRTACSLMVPFEVTYRLIQVGGRIAEIECRATVVRNAEGEPEHLLGFTIDATERITAQREVEQKQIELEEKNDLLELALLDAQSSFEAMVYALAKAVEAKDPYTAGHSERVMKYAVAIGGSMALPHDQLKVLETACLIHDIGKIGIPDNVLMKPGKLTDEEFKIIQTHPEVGARMVERIPAFQSCLPIIRGHHEKLDGTGYPDGLHGEEIDLLTRITTVADIFDAMTSSRAYREAIDPDTVLENLRSIARKGQIDGEVVEVLADIISKEGILFSAENTRKAA